LKIRIKKLTTAAVVPTYAHGPDEDAGMDLRATHSANLHPGVPLLIGTGLALEIPSGYEAQIRPRSGLAAKQAVTVANAPATIDPGYRGELKVCLINLGHSPYLVMPGDRIAQLVVAKYEAVEWEEAETLSDTARAAGGFGSSGR
jgi:dUTP pyrophosphatase